MKPSNRALEAARSVARMMVAHGFTTNEKLREEARIYQGGRQVYGPPEDVAFWLYWDGQGMRKR